MNQLMQIEHTDILLLKDLLNQSNYKNKILSSSEIEITDDQYAFSVKTSTPGDFQKTIVGFSFIQKIDWISRHAEFCIFPKEQNKKSTYDICSIVLDFGFNQINMNKMWTEVCDNKEMQEILPDFGFVLEGVRRKAKFQKGKWIDTKIFGLLHQEYVK